MMLACLLLITLSLNPFTLQATKKTSSALPVVDSESQESQKPAEEIAHRNQTAPAEPATQPSSITITNTIKPDMLTYKHWTGKYNPDSFKVFVNDTEVAQGNSLDLPSETKTVNLKFDYSFVNGKRTGSKTVAYKLNEDTTKANITFSWDNDNKIIIDSGTAVAS